MPGSIATSDEWQSIHRENYDTEPEKTPADAVVRALAVATGRDPMDCPPLYEYVEPDALNKLFDGCNTETDSETLLQFTYDDWQVFVRGGGTVTVCEGERSHS